MAANRPSSRKSRFPIFTILGVLIVLGVVLAAGGFAFAATQESHDPFCASCHTQPESTFFERSVSAQAVDLASFHTSQETRCIDCHSGPGISGRMQAELLGARNAAAWYLHAATQPAPLTHPIGDANCLKCHQDITQRGFVPKQSFMIQDRGGEEGEEGRANHWHVLLTRWQAAGPNAGSCTSCHPGHSTSGSAQTGFQDVQMTQRTCDACHQVLRNERGGD